MRRGQPRLLGRVPWVRNRGCRGSLSPRTRDPSGRRWEDDYGRRPEQREILLGSPVDQGRPDA